MDDRAALLLAWLEGEGERQRRPALYLQEAEAPDLRGRVQVGVCVLGGALACALFVCWLARGREQEVRTTCVESLRRLGLLRITSDPDRLELPPEWWVGGRRTARSSGGARVMVLCALVFILDLGIVTGAMFLRVACGLYNHLAGGTGSPGSVPIPLFGKATGILILTTLIQAVAGYVIGLLFNTGGAYAGARERGLTAFAQLLLAPLVLASMNSALLPTTFARGLLVVLCYYLVILSVIAVLGGLFVAVPLPR